tara:strand:- start:1450 stop:2007 length:558 start_codon:yes stop_codon:yes gene_type:complete
MDLLINNNIDNVSDIKEKKNTTKSLKTKKNNDCQELKNIAYKTMLLNGNDINPKHTNCKTELNISDFLEGELNANKKESWAKLDKTQRIIKLNKYAEDLKLKYKLSDIEFENLKKYFIKCLDRKLLIKSKEINYNKDSGNIINIPYLYFNEETRIFILKKDDKHVSTIKSLPQDKRGRSKTIKNN